MLKRKAILFRGSRERLNRMVKRYGGKFLEDHKFELFWQPEHFKPMHRKTFRIDCRYEKEEEGYRLAYRIIPTVWSFLRMMLAAAFWVAGAMYVWDPAEPLASVAAGLLGTTGVLTDIWQLRTSEKEFLQRFTAITR